MNTIRIEYNDSPEVETRLKFTIKSISSDNRMTKTKTQHKNHAHNTLQSAANSKGGKHDNYLIIKRNKERLGGNNYL